MLDQREFITKTNIEDEMKTSYIDYAMSVIIGRALPDVRDGLKPVHRRIIYAMNDLGLASNKAYKKSARIVGETMGKYHPHGDMAIYDSLVRMAQDFSIRYPLIDGQGNFGSVDGDPAAASRYTEARMSKFSELLLSNIEKETVDFRPNYDGSENEPSVLPSAFPNLLVNGSQGIAVGMATNIPPHNLGEVIDATILLIDNPEATIRDILKVMPGPDFPTGAYIYGRAGILQAYETARGCIKLRAKLNTEQMKNGKECIIVTELPYMVNKAKLLEEIANLVKDKKIEGITDIRDESDRDGMRIFIELRKNEIAQVIVNQLYKHTQMQTTFGIIFLAIVNGKPRYLPVNKVILHYIEHQKEVIFRRTRFDLEKAEARAHILEGLRIALDDIDAVITTIRASNTTNDAKENLMSKFGLSEIQAQSILEMRLQRLTGLEREKIESEYRELTATISYLRSVLDDPQKVLQIIKDELTEVKQKYGDKRQTQILDSTADMSIEDLIAEENMVITVTHSGYIKRTPTSTYRRQNRGGRGLTGMDTKEEDWVEHLFIGTTHNYILFFTNKGKAYWLKVYELPQGGRATKGRAMANLLEVEPGEEIKSMIPVSEFDDQHFLIMATKKGQVVKNALNLYSNPRKTGIKAVNVADDDELIDVKLTTGDQDIFLATKDGNAIRFNESEVRPCGRFTSGVKGITLRKGDYVVGMEIPRRGSTILTVCKKGYGKRTEIDEYRPIHRGGKGVISIKTGDRNGDVVCIKEVFDEDELMIITEQGVLIRSSVSSLRAISRATMGVRLINLDEKDLISGVARLQEKDEGGSDDLGVDDFEDEIIDESPNPEDNVIKEDIPNTEDSEE